MQHMISTYWCVVWECGGYEESEESGLGGLGLGLAGMRSAYAWHVLGMTYLAFPARPRSRWKTLLRYHYDSSKKTRNNGDSIC
jgi:hypothetical protein